MSLNAGLRAYQARMRAARRANRDRIAERLDLLRVPENRRNDVSAAYEVYLRTRANAAWDHRLAGPAYLDTAHHELPACVAERPGVDWSDCDLAADFS